MQDLNGKRTRQCQLKEYTIVLFAVLLKKIEFQMKCVFNVHTVATHLMLQQIHHPVEKFQIFLFTVGECQAHVSVTIKNLCELHFHSLSLSKNLKNFKSLN